MNERVEFNINSYVWFKLTDKGREVHRKHYEHIILDIPSYKYSPLKEDDNGLLKCQMWEVMAIWGPSIHMGIDICFESNIFIFDNKDFTIATP